jgi:hypothetical protein
MVQQKPFLYPETHSKRTSGNFIFAEVKLLAVTISKKESNLMHFEI